MGTATAAATECLAPTAAQTRSVVEPLERALHIYSGMQNASQVAACHYQVSAATVGLVAGYAVPRWREVASPRGVSRQEACSVPPRVELELSRRQLPL